MSAIIPFESAKVPAYLVANRIAGINKEVLTGAGQNFPTLSIKGKVFTLVKGSERKVLTREIEGEEVTVQSLTMTVARANTKYRVFFAKAYAEGDEAAKPVCMSQDSITPSIHASEPQAKKCQACQHAVWGTGNEGKGTACSVKTRLAVVDPSNLGREAFLLNVPAASRKSFAQAVEAAENRGIDYNALVLRISFDKETASPKLVFKPVGWLDDKALAIVQGMYDSEIVREMVGANTEVAAAPVKTVDTDEPDAAIATRQAVETAKGKAKATAAPVKAAVEDDEDEPAAPVKVEKPKTRKPEKSTVSDASDLLADMDALLGNTDD